MPGSRIIMLTHEFAPKKGGIAVYTEEMARAATNAGHVVEVWAPASPELNKSNFPFEIKQLPLKGSQDWSCRLRLARALKGQSFKNCTLYLPEPGPIVTWMYLQLIKPIDAEKLIITLHGSEILKFSSWAYRKALFQKLLNRADTVSVVSHFCKNLITERLSASPIITPGALRHNFKTPPQHTPHNGPLRILTVGRIHPRKGQLAVVEALATIPQDERAKFEYWIAGPIVDQHYCKKIKILAEKKGIKLRFVGVVEDDALPQLYAETDIFALTSMPYHRSVEGYGLVYLEAGACGLPSIAHNLGGVGEAVRDGETGLLADPYDRKSLAKCITKLSNDKELRQKLGTAAKARAREYSWEDHAKTLFS